MLHKLSKTIYYKPLEVGGLYRIATEFANNDMYPLYPVHTSDSPRLPELTIEWVDGSTTIMVVEPFVIVGRTHTPHLDYLCDKLNLKKGDFSVCVKFVNLATGFVGCGVEIMSMRTLASALPNTSRFQSLSFLTVPSQEQIGSSDLVVGSDRYWRLLG